MYERSASVGKPLTVRNANYKADIRNTTRIVSYILTSIGIWPAVFKGIGRFLPITLIVICNLALCCTIIPSVLHTIYEEENVGIRMKLVGLLSFAIAASVKFVILALSRPIILQCIKHVEEDWKLVESQLDREVMLKHGRVGRNLTMLCSSLLYAGGIIYHASMPFGKQNEDDDQSHAYNHTMRNMYPTYAGFFDCQKSPVYELVLATQLIAEYVTYSATAGGYSLIALLVTHTFGQLEIIISHLKDLIDGDIFAESSNVDVRLKIIVQRHLRVLGFTSMIERMLQEVCLVEFVSSALMMCLIEYHCILEWRDRNVKGFVGFVSCFVSVVFNIFVLCYIGELLTERTSDVGETCYMVEWYRLPIQTSRELILIMGMSNNPARITAGGIVDLTMTTFGNILKTSLAYYSFFRTTVA